MERNATLRLASPNRDDGSLTAHLPSHKETCMPLVIERVRAEDGTCYPTSRP